MSPEFILLIISVLGNFIVILKRIKLIYTPCISIDCRSNQEGDDIDTQEAQPQNTSMIKRIINRMTPRSKDKAEKAEIPV